jgi:hypothetical protein
VNPAGVAFELCRYRQAPGVLVVGTPSREFSWYPGCAWQVASCRGCGVHLGWWFSGASDFFGLIVDRLIPAAEETPSAG